MPKTKTLICDLDGCLVDWNPAFRELLARLHGPRGDFQEALHQWSWPHALGYTNKEIDQAWDHCDTEWWINLEARPGAVAALQKLDRLRGYNKDFVVYFITGRHPWTQFASSAWLSWHGFQRAAVVCSSWKSKLAVSLNIDGPVAAVEDKPGIIHDYYDAGIAPLYIVNQTYNNVAPFDTPPFISNSIRRVETVLEAVNHLSDEWQLKEKPQLVPAAK